MNILKFEVVEAAPKVLVFRMVSQYAFRPGEARDGMPLSVSLSNAVDATSYVSNVRDSKEDSFYEDSLRRNSAFQYLRQPGFSVVEYGTSAADRVYYRRHRCGDLCANFVLLPEGDECLFERLPFGVDATREAECKLAVMHDEFFNKELDLITFDGHGDTSNGCPMVCGGLLTSGILRLAGTLNSDVRRNYLENIHRCVQKQLTDLSALPASLDKVVEREYFDSSHCAPVRARVATVDGFVARSTIDLVKGQLNDLADSSAFKEGGSLQIQTKALVLASCFSAGFIPLLAPLVVKGGFIVCYLNEGPGGLGTCLANELAGLSDITPQDIMKKIVCFRKDFGFENRYHRSTISPFVVVQKDRSGKLIAHIMMKSRAAIATEARAYAGEESDWKCFAHFDDAVAEVRCLHDLGIKCKIYGSAEEFDDVFLSLSEPVDNVDVIADDFSKLDELARVA